MISTGPPDTECLVFRDKREGFPRTKSRQAGGIFGGGFCVISFLLRSSVRSSVGLLRHVGEPIKVSATPATPARRTRWRGAEGVSGYQPRQREVSSDVRV